jgi:hypothetical protein
MTKRQVDRKGKKDYVQPVAIEDVITEQIAAVLVKSPHAQGHRHSGSVRSDPPIDRSKLT